jgi:hypothetical protein
MTGTHTGASGQGGSAGAAPTWRVVAGKELADLWLSGKALVLLILYSILLSGITFVLASNSELSLMPPKEMVYETLKTAISVGLFLGLVIGVDALSGERERATLETLLLTPTSRRQIFVGKFLAAVSPWPAALLITVPYLAVLAQGDSILLPAILEGALVGSIMALGFAGLGMLVSFFTNSNRTSFFVALGLYTLGLVPAQLPGTAQTGATGQFLQWVNPQAAASHFLSKTLVNHRTLEEFWPWLLSPVLFTVLGLGLLLGYAAPRLSLEAPRLRLAGGERAQGGGGLGRRGGAAGAGRPPVQSDDSASAGLPGAGAPRAGASRRGHRAAHRPGLPGNPAGLWPGIQVSTATSRTFAAHHRKPGAQDAEGDGARDIRDGGGQHQPGAVAAHDGGHEHRQCRQGR